MANTTNLNLAKPAGTDKALVSVLNSNSDKIDAWAGTTNQALSKVNTVKSITASMTTDNFAEGLNAISWGYDQTIDGVTPANSMRGYLVKATNAMYGVVANASGTVVYYIGYSQNAWHVTQGTPNRETITSRLSSSYGTITAYESFVGNLCAVAITFKCTTAIAKNATFMTGLKASQVNRAPVVAMYNTDDGKVYHATVSSSGELTSHVEALPTGDYRMSFAYVT